MELGVFLVVGIIEAIGFGVLMNFSVAKRRAGLKSYLKSLQQGQASKQELKEKFEALYEKMIDVGSLRKKAEEYMHFQESLKAERGRITITQAEMETVDGRLRELEEIERELEASGLETKEEFNILEKKHADLTNKKATLQGKIDESSKKLESVLSEIEMTAQMQEQVDAMKAQLLQTEQKIDSILLEIEGGNDQYFILKKRYDALDIEYAQLYEKFSAMESASGGGGD